MAERVVQTAKQILMKSESDHKDLNELLLDYRYTTIPHLGAAPCELIINRLIQIKFQFVIISYIPKYKKGSMKNNASIEKSIKIIMIKQLETKNNLWQVII